MDAQLFWGVTIALFLTLPLAWKWQLGVKKSAVFVSIVGVGYSSAIAFIVPSLTLLQLNSIACVATLFTATAFVAHRFYRDPDRITPSVEGAFLSPADGVIAYVKRVERGEIPVATKRGRRIPLTDLLKTGFGPSEAWLIGISMNFLDVHVNRAPITGQVVFRSHFPGGFGSLRLPDRVFDNERMTTIIDGGELRVAVVQIASRLVRQIVSYVSPGDMLVAGQRIGAIRLGSQVDVVFPHTSDLTVQVRCGDRVRAGKSILAAHTAPAAVTPSTCTEDAAQHYLEHPSATAAARRATSR